ncbi:MAG: type II toxin-antitoxin system death-on-curing family toxin [Pseudolysinimonas sp.]
MATAADLDVEQILVALWSEGVEYPLEPSSRIRPADIGIAERAVGLASNRHKRIAYWLTELNITRDELAAVLKEYELSLHPKANTLPKGAIRRLRAHYSLDSVQFSQAPELEERSVPKAAEPFIWRAIGTHRECVHLTAKEILTVHIALTSEFLQTDDPIAPPGVKSQALLESAAGRSSTSYGDEAKYPTIESAAAALLHSVVHNHPFHNGNKRTALVATLVLLDRHDLMLDSTEEELFRFMVKVAAHDLLPAGFVYDQVPDREVDVISHWLRDRTHLIRTEERSVTWRDLQRKLRQRSQKDCEITKLRGEKYRIRRTFELRRRFLGARRYQVLDAYYTNTGDGREVPRSVVKKIRKDLMLDLEHGVDAEAFYGDYKGADFFIAEYSKLLRRLARV